MGALWVYQALGCILTSIVSNSHFGKRLVAQDMILAAFDGKFHEKKDEIPPQACRPPYTFIYPILGI